MTLKLNREEEISKISFVFVILTVFQGQEELLRYFESLK